MASTVSPGESLQNSWLHMFEAKNPGSTRDTENVLFAPDESSTLSASVAPLSANLDDA